MNYLALLKSATKTALSVTGEGSFLRGTEPCTVRVMHGVEIVGEDNNVVYTRSVAIIDADMQPRFGDRLSHPDGEFTLENTIKDNGMSKQIVLMKYTGA